MLIPKVHNKAVKNITLNKFSVKSNLINNLKHFLPKLYAVPKDDEFELDFQYVFFKLWY